MVSNLPAPGPSLTMQDPQFNRKYYLYVPSNYKDQREWSLVITCHGTKYFDTAKLQFDNWKGLAEQKGFLLVAPELVGTSGAHPKTAKQIARQMEDEAAILSIISSVRAARSVNRNRIFLTGWSAGAYAVLFTGLRNPDIFRALSVRQGNFKPEFLEPCIPFMDRYQPVQIVYGSADPLDSSQPCIDWLRQHDLEPTTRERPGIHKREPQPVFEFFADVVRKRPWIRVHIHDDPQDLMQVQFRVKASFEPRRYRWDFGDNQRSPIASPQHKYKEPGTYTVKMAVWTEKGAAFTRSLKLKIPRTQLGAKPPENTTE
ncbi:MAG: PKD domain-containing protein [Planctomycetota bacterium]